MKETKETKKSRNITFRLTDEEYGQVEKAATAAGDDPNNWCRKAAVSQLSEGHTFTTNERLIYQEIALLRFLVGHGFKLAFGRNEATPATWKKLTAQADQRSDEIVAELLSRRGVWNRIELVREQQRDSAENSMGRSNQARGLIASFRQK